MYYHFWFTVATHVKIIFWSRTHFYIHGRFCWNYCCRHCGSYKQMLNDFICLWFVAEVGANVLFLFLFLFSMFRRFSFCCWFFWFAAKICWLTSECQCNIVTFRIIVEWFFWTKIFCSFDRNYQTVMMAIIVKHAGLHHGQR